MSDSASETLTEENFDRPRGRDLQYRCQSRVNECAREGIVVRERSRENENEEQLQRGRAEWWGTWREVEGE